MVEFPPVGSALWDWLRYWPKYVEEVNRRDVVLAGVLRSCRPVRVIEDGVHGTCVLTIGAPKGFHIDRLRERANVSLLCEVASLLSGGGYTVKAVFYDDSMPPHLPVPPHPPHLRVLKSVPDPDDDRWSARLARLTPSHRKLFEAIRDSSLGALCLDPSWVFGPKLAVPECVSRKTHIRPDLHVWYRGSRSNGMLVIEVDGNYHQGPAQRHEDEARERMWERLGFHFMRFSNEECLKLTACLKEIKDYCTDIWGPPRPLGG